MFEIVVQKYREELIHYCIAQTHMSYADAEDIVQEVFLTLYTKKNINFQDNIRAWLYETARRKIKSYYRKNPLHDDLDAAADRTDVSYEISDEAGGSILDVLTKEEYQLLSEYYSGCDRNSMAAKMGLTPNALYCRILRIRIKIMKGGDYHDR